MTTTVAPNEQMMTTAPRRNRPLVFERVLAGHRQNYAETIGHVLGARVVLGKSLAALMDAVFSRHLVVTTLESAPRLYSAILIARALVGARSTVIATRWHVLSPRRTFQSTLRRMIQHLLLWFEPIQVLSITPPSDIESPKAPRYIEDIEFWDLPQAVFDGPPRSSLADEVDAAKGGRKAIVALGTLDISKGLLFLEQIFDATPALSEQYVVVCCGEVMEPSRAALEPLRRRAAVWVDRFLDRDELLSLYRQADVVWCCYEPGYDVSSGVFGRAIQLGRPTITRAGSIVARLADRAGHGTSIDYGDIGSAASLLARGLGPGSTPSSRHDAISAKFRDLVTTHANSP